MRRLSLIVLCLAMTACGNEEVGESGACAAAVVWHDTLYIGAGSEGGTPPLGEALEDGIEPACNDGAPNNDRDRAARLRRVAGVAPEVAVYVESGNYGLYLNPGALTELPEHPLHDRFYARPDRPRRRARGRPCQVDEELSLSDGYPSLSAPRRSVIVNARTRIEGFDHAGMPILATGDLVRIHGRCRRGAIHARLIEPRP